MQDIVQLSQRLLSIHNYSYKRYFLKQHRLDHNFEIILGQRGVGKTTIMIQHLLDCAAGDLFSDQILYIQADHFLVQTWTLYEIAELFLNFGGKIIGFDEIHKYSNWSIELKSIADTFPELKIIASGSSTLEIHKSSSDLSRRALVNYIQGMSFREYLEMSLGIELPTYSLTDILTQHPQITSDIINKLKEEKILSLFKKYLRHGYYPYYFEHKDENIFYHLLNQNIHTILESDLISTHPGLTGNSIKKIISLLRIIASSVPFFPDMNKMAQLTDIGDQRTLKNYLKYIEDAGLIMSLSSAGKGFKKMEKPEKIYLSNPNLLYAFSGEADPGMLRETFFMSMVGSKYEIKSPKKTDFLVQNKYIFEIGGKKKNFSQIKDMENAFLAVDDIEMGAKNKIPLWLFGFLY